jgi:hypothetical protein
VTFVDRNRRVAANFLQSAIVFDDAPFFQEVETEEVSNEAAAPAAGDVLLEPSGSDKPHELIPPPNQPEPDHEVGVDAKRLGDAFGREGLICGFLKPTLGEAQAIGDLVAKAARRADIVILDWSIDRDQGDATLGVIDQILAADDEEGEERLRLIAIYTSRPETDAILNRVRECVDRHLPRHAVVQEGFTVTKGPLCITLYAKDTAHVLGTPAAARACGEDELPARLVADFANMAAGLVPLVALAGLAAVRSETHRILSVLSGALDPAYVAQRVLISDPHEAAEQLVALVTGELRSVMEDKRVGDEAGDEAILDWLRWQTQAGKVLGLSAGNDEVNDLAALLEHGLSAPAADEAQEITAMRNHANLKTLLKRKKEVETATRLFAVTDAAADEANDRFAMQVSLRTQYSNPPRVLQLGTLVRDLGGNYYLCVQPICDSVRIGAEREFPFLPAVESADPFDLVVRDPAGARRTLMFQRKPFMLKKILFPASPGVGCVQAAEIDGAFRFTDAADNAYVWIARLDEGYAQRVVHGLGAALSRIGVNEFEWLRSKMPTTGS